MPDIIAGDNPNTLNDYFDKKESGCQKAANTLTSNIDGDWDKFQQDMDTGSPDPEN